MGEFNAAEWMKDFYGHVDGITSRPTTFDWWGIPVIESKHVPRGTAYLVAGNQLIWGTGEPDTRTWARREARRIFKESATMRKWYEYIGE